MICSVLGRFLEDVSSLWASALIHTCSVALSKELGGVCGGVLERLHQEVMLLKADAECGLLQIVSEPR